MKNAIYDAKFISADPAWDKICPVFKKDFSLGGKIKSAKLHISALGIYEAKINGKRVGRDYMTPGWTSYQKRLQYQTYDVTDMLSESNTITVGAGHGWYASRIGYVESVKGYYDQFPAIICALEVAMRSGEKTVILSDESWQVAKSEVTFSGIYDGETVDARIVPDFSEKIYIVDYDKSRLIPMEGVPVRETERLSVKEIITTPKGECVLDFGQNMTGLLEFTVNSKSGGDCLTVECAEILDKDGNFYNANYRSAKSRMTYITRPGTQTFRARYTFFGFRYLRLSGFGDNIKAEDFTAIQLNSDMKRTGYFKCGHGKVNKLYENVIWGHRDNFLDVPTDCPQRDERLGWTGDAQVFARTALINYDCESFFKKWLRDMAVEQCADGRIPYVIPYVLNEARSTSAAWGDCSVIVPWELYMAYGNKKLLREHYPMMKKWVGYILSRPGKKYLWQNTKHLGDWLGMDSPKGSNSGGTNRELIASAYFYYCTKTVARAGRELGMSYEKYEKMAERIRCAFIKEYVKRGKLISDTQTAHVLALHFGLCDERADLKEAFSKRLVELIEANGDRLTTGFVGTPYLLDTLTEIGRADKAYALLTQEAFPSWLFSVNMGATTIWEHWDGLREDGSVWSDEMNSFNHYAYGSVASWMYGTVGGIRPIDPAYKRIRIAPIPSKLLGYASASVETRCGTVSSSWVYEGERVRYSFTIPEGVVALVTIGNSTEELSGGSYTRWG